MFPKYLLKFGINKLTDHCIVEFIRLITLNKIGWEAVLHLREPKSDKPHQGFTLIELIVVVVILGILAAVALPRFVSMGTEARIAVLNATAGTARSALDMVFSKCVVTPSCDVNVPYHTSGTPSTLTLNGVTHQLQYGYFWQDSTGQGGGLQTMLNLTSFTIYYNGAPAGQFSQFYQLGSAPDPTHCYMTYLPPQALGQAYQVSTVVSGC